MVFVFVDANKDLSPAACEGGVRQKIGCWATSLERARLRLDGRDRA